MIAVIFLFTFIIHLYFGHLRSRATEFSFPRFFWIHIPILFVFLSRLLSPVDFRYVPVVVFAAVSGQLLGGKLEV